MPTPMSSLAITPTPRPAVTYVVQRGDTLIDIARKYGVSVADIQEMNAIADPRLLQIGQELVISLGEASDAEPEAIPVSVEVSNIASYETPVGSLWFLGEVENTSERGVEGVQVVVSLYDEVGQTLATESAFTELSLIPAGGKAPFAILFTDPPLNFKEYTVVAQGGVVAHEGIEYRDLEVIDHSTEAEGYLYTITGEVRNIGQFDAESVVVVVTAYDAEGRVVAIRDVYTELEIIPSGGSSPFAARLYPAAGTVVTYSVQAQGKRVQSAP